jgi:hypothetical protein
MHRLLLAASLAACACALVFGGVANATISGNPTVQFVPFPDYYFTGLPIPSDLKVTCIDGPGSTTEAAACPVIQWGDVTYWAYSFCDNRTAMRLVAYEGGAIVDQWDIPNDRYIWQITIDDTAQTISFWGQYSDINGGPQTFNWASLAPGTGIGPATGGGGCGGGDNDLALANTPADMTVNATSAAGAVVSYTPPTAVDEDAVSVTCDHPSGSTFAIGTTTVTCSASEPNDTNSPVSTSFNVTVVGAAGQLQALAAAVAGVGPGKSLAAKVAAAQADVAAGNTAGAKGVLNAFINEVKAQAGKKIPAAQAAQLIAAAQQIIAVLG